METDIGGYTSVVYSQEPTAFGALISQWAGGQAAYPIYDGLGSTQLLTNALCAITDSYAFTAFGVPVPTGAANPTFNPFQFVGQPGYYLDKDTANSYVRNRVYSPSLARWLSQDPIGFGGGDWNLYRYVRNDPTRATDPAGTTWNPFNPDFWNFLFGAPPGPAPPPPVAPLPGPSQAAEAALRWVRIMRQFNNNKELAFASIYRSMQAARAGGLACEPELDMLTYIYTTFCF